MLKYIRILYELLVLKCFTKIHYSFFFFQINEIDPEVLFPPESKGELEELLLDLICFLLGGATVLILSKLAYDYWRYRTKGQLPWMALNMPF